MGAPRFLLGLLPALGLGALALVWDARRALDRPLPVAAPQVFEVESGDSMKKVLYHAVQKGLITSNLVRLYTEVYARASGRAALLKAGEYEARPGLTPRGLIALVTSGKTVLHELTLVEGLTFDLVLHELRRHPAIRQTLDADVPAAAMAAIGQRDLHPEGRFLPETYRFARGTTDVAFLKRAYDAMQAAMREEWDARAPGLPYRDPYEALIMASIVERETGVAAERPQIAGVFVRRLQKGMLLQTDPSVIYGLGGAFDGNLRRRDLLADTPYNTYTRRGLPPTPICMPGRAAIRAALHPADGNSLYFVARGDGSHQFSATLDEHNQAVRRYQLKR
ncbi:MAG: endolytic transglycosylase MltG [Gammaproteobacteria bacterium]|nr:endolytic transglycosylase MltG [Gammaproteobacteria bacterium]